MLIYHRYIVYILHKFADKFFLFFVALLVKQIYFCVALIFYYINDG